MTTRLLPPEEWGRLASTELGAVLEHLDPARAAVLVVEADGVIVGCWGFLRVVHLEGLWIAEAHRRRGRVARRLWRGMLEAVRGWGERAVMTSALSPEVEDLARRIGGVELPGKHFTIGVESSCQQPLPSR